MKIIKIIKSTVIVWLFMLITSFVVLFLCGIIWNEQGYVIEQLSRGFGILCAGFGLAYYLSKTNKKISKKLFSTFSYHWKSIQIFFSTLFLTLSFLISTFILAGALGFYKYDHFATSQFNVNEIVKYFLLAGLMANAFAAIGEEILFRGYLLNYFESFFSNRNFAIVISAIIFSIGHLQFNDFLTFVLAFAGGIVTGYSYLKFKTIYIPIAIHLGYNLFNFSLASEPVDGKLLPYILKLKYQFISNSIGAWLDLFTLLSFVFLFIYFYFKKTREMKYTIFSTK